MYFPEYFFLETKECLFIVFQRIAQSLNIHYLRPLMVPVDSFVLMQIFTNISHVIQWLSLISS